MAATSKRALWKGAISFGLVHIPISLHSATASQGIDFDWLDKRSMDPVGYKRINKATGKEIDSDDVVKGVEYEEGQYVVLSAEEIQAAYPTTTQTIEIERFVSVDDIPFVYLDRPYYTSPIAKGAKVYALLREVLRKTGVVGIAKVVIQTKQHLAILMPCGPALILNLLRWGDEIRPWDELGLPEEGTESTGITAKEMTMGEQLVKDMSGAWEPDAFTDSFKEQILQLVKEKVESGDTESVNNVEEDTETTGSAKILDLTEMLQRSLGKNKGQDTGSSKKSTSKKPAPQSTSKAANTKASAKAKSASTSAETGGTRRAGKTTDSAKGSKTTAKTERKVTAKKTAKKSPPRGRKAA
ncbi:Ku protein [Pusillimonas sp. ANT_WB101]|uniref:non-homologous end joining protein Ku n=1 Tax=Pusillimonas sp. ANT_WB101 TaxID=2597356 RepID=UPI0011EC2996|nr:Ku protein [Pusillimonas sp. ANT_WB101]KAA0890835.1 Ku protein [Pusillimonas sp. ANT_WB101]